MKLTKPSDLRSQVNHIMHVLSSIQKRLFIGGLTGQWKYNMFKRLRAVENELMNRYNRVKRENPDAAGLCDERLGYIPIELHVALVKDNRRILESILGGYSKGSEMINLSF